MASISLIQFHESPQGVGSFLRLEFRSQLLDSLSQFADGATVQFAAQFGKTPQGVCQRPGVKVAHLACYCLSQGCNNTCDRPLSWSVAAFIKTKLTGLLCSHMWAYIG